MKKEVVKLKLHEARSNLKMAEIVLEMHENGVRELREEIEELEEIINKPDRWQDSLVQPYKESYFYLIDSVDEGLVVFGGFRSERKPEHAFKTEEQAELIKEKVLLMQEMYAFAHVKNEGWMPDWEDDREAKFGIAREGDKIQILQLTYVNPFVFSVAVKSMAIAKEMMEIFGERIEKFYDKQY